MKWFREARFGMFIHWGVYSVPAGTYNGKRIGGIGEWIMNTGKIPMKEYQAYAKEFNPVDFDADEWVKTAKYAGMKYIVITSKHHDGFAMFHSKVSDWNIFDATPFKRDPLAELAAACKKYGMRLGFYYSQAQDWNHPGGAAAGGHWDKGQDGDMGEYIKNVAVPQVREILTNYGKVSCLWWDTPVGMTKEYADELLPLLKLQPGIIYNNRLGGGYKGDTETPEQYIPATGYPGRDWETCMTMNDTWGYKSYDDNWKSSETLIRNLVDIASKGGNYLLNVGPTSLGQFPSASVERLKTIGDWMKDNSKAIYATTASPFKRLAWGRCTKVADRRGATLYLHVFDWPKDGKLVVPGLLNPVTSASMLVGGTRLKATNVGQNVEIQVPDEPQNPYSTTVVLKVRDQLQVVQPQVMQNIDGTLDLVPGDAEIHGSELQVEGDAHQENFGFWTNPSDWLEWTFVIDKPGIYTVSTEVASVGGAKFSVGYGDQQVTYTAPNTGDYKKYERVQLRRIEVKEHGKAVISVHAIADGWHPINLRALKIRPVR
ncbi:MAG: alpha-L-fucosidase [Armatimonadetes bacterium]|nr:alpha-L-fucosidase [Armatimonadota bacterium]MBS1726887.1 alpha-L-fucosidase [Armatimonadota bacterium]